MNVINGVYYLFFWGKALLDCFLVCEPLVSLAHELQRGSERELAVAGKAFPPSGVPAEYSVRFDLIFYYFFANI